MWQIYEKFIGMANGIPARNAQILVIWGFFAKFALTNPSYHVSPHYSTIYPA